MKELIGSSLDFDQVADLETYEQDEYDEGNCKDLENGTRNDKALELWLKHKHRFKPPETDKERFERIKKLETRTLVINGVEIEVRIGSLGMPWFIDKENRDKLEASFDPQVLKNIRDNKRDLYVYHKIIQDNKEDWMPLPGIAASYLPGVRIVHHLYNVDKYLYITVMHDSNRNYTWTYQQSHPSALEHFDPMKPLDNYVLEGTNIRFCSQSWDTQNFPITQNKYRPYVPKEYFNPPRNPRDSYPRKTPDTGVFRHPKLEDLYHIKFKNMNPPLNENDPNPAPFGYYREHQSFWPTVSIKKNALGIPIRHVKLGCSDLVISKVGLGTMNFGYNVKAPEGLKLLDYAHDEFGINFLDTSELYPLPAQPETHGIAEGIIGNWLKSKGPEFRAKVVIATKVAGRNKDITWVRGEGGTRLSPEQITQAVDQSLERLQTDYIDLLQFHWPDRYVPMQDNGDFGQVLYDPEIRAWGLSNETPWGVLQFARLAMEMQIPPPASVQVNYNLLCRNDVEKGLVELARPQNQGLALLAYSPLAGGILTGKYLEYMDATTNARLLRFPSYMGRYRGSLAARAVKEYYEVAMKFGLPNLTAMALRWVYTRPFICSTIIGFSDLYQLRENLYCMDPELPMTDLMERSINQIHWKWRDPIRIIQ
ncbi:bifunctional NADP-dependent oxidoreductase domain superfamily/NADP-dependent oxidoreductase domain [Babesia duncani]|uniref:Bifunctional NADP-dependent oxidoreductase domain superfamily/NADP-dependent oxidoreductase domain n=1 Tax=Babesia duncani TaxID=323732 RepID=A0AAD9UQ82_9APIC|nr:bifunctional NADP-dependent oxidoreductase domain superfamily/NADP-dependent oxidoreductase domain [Babesia duncani]